MRCLIVGDVHGEFKGLNHYMNRIQGTINYDVILQVGDFGFWKESLQSSKKKFPEMCKRPIYFVRGNHEEYSRYNRHRVIEPFFNDYEGVIVPNYFVKCRHIPRYLNDETVEINGLKVLGVGGAVSTDREYRVLGYSWWKEEEVDRKNVMRIIKKSLKPDIVIRHDGPSHFFRAGEYNYLFPNRAGDKLLGKLYDHIKPRFWFFGHFHVYMEWEDPRSGTRFVCFPTWNKGYGILDTKLMELEMKNW